MAADSSKARNLIGELRGCLDKLGQAVDQSSSKSVASVPNGAHRGGSASSDDVEKRIAAAEAGRKRAEKLLNEALEAKKEAEMRAAEAEQGRANVQQLLSWVHEAEKKKKMVFPQPPAPLPQNGADLAFPVSRRGNTAEGEKASRSSDVFTRLLCAVRGADMSRIALSSLL
eukprot:2686795-Rhodomonas_salina.1